MLDSPELRERDRLTAEAFADPQVGDRFHEMYSFWVYVVAVEPEGRVAVLTATPPCVVPRDGKLEIHPSAEKFRKAYAYGTIPGYSVDLAERGNDVTGWFPGWPEPEPSPPPERVAPLPVRRDLPEPTEAEVEHLVSVISDAWGRGVRYGDWTLARWILAAGYRLVPEPPPVKYGQCRSCSGTHPLTAEGMVVQHDDPRPGHGQCLCSRMTPLRQVPAPEAVSVDG